MQGGLRTWKHGCILWDNPVFLWSEWFRQPRNYFITIFNKLRKQDLVKQEGSMPHLEQQCVYLPCLQGLHPLCPEHVSWVKEIQLFIVKLTFPFDQMDDKWFALFFLHFFVGGNGDRGKLHVGENLILLPFYLLMSKRRIKNMERDMTCIDHKNILDRPRTICLHWKETKPWKFLVQL